MYDKGFGVGGIEFPLRRPTMERKDREGWERARKRESLLLLLLFGCAVWQWPRSLSVLKIHYSAARIMSLQRARSRPICIAYRKRLRNSGRAHHASTCTNTHTRFAELRHRCAVCACKFNFHRRILFWMLIVEVTPLPAAHILVILHRKHIVFNSFNSLCCSKLTKIWVLYINKN